MTDESQVREKYIGAISDLQTHQVQEISEMTLQNVLRNNYSMRVKSVISEYRGLSHLSWRRSQEEGGGVLKRWPFYITEIPWLANLKLPNIWTPSIMQCSE